MHLGFQCKRKQGHFGIQLSLSKVVDETACTPHSRTSRTSCCVVHAQMHLPFMGANKKSVQLTAIPSSLMPSPPTHSALNTRLADLDMICLITVREPCQGVLEPWEPCSHPLYLPKQEHLWMGNLSPEPCLSLGLA